MNAPPVKTSLVKAAVLHVAIIGIFGILVPQRQGMGFFDPLFIAAYSCLGILFAAPYAASSFARSRPQNMKEAALRILQAVGYGLLMVAAILVAAVITVNSGRRNWRWPELDTLGMSLLFGVCAALACVVLAAWLALRFSPNIARTGVRFVFFAGVVAFFYWPTRLPDIALPGAGLAVLFSVGMLFLIWREVHPSI